MRSLSTDAARMRFGVLLLSSLLALELAGAPAAAAPPTTASAPATPVSAPGAPALPSGAEPPAAEPPAAEPLPASPPPADTVRLVVGLKAGADGAAPVARLADATGIDAVHAAPVTGTAAVTVEVPSGDQAAAAAALRWDPAVAFVEPDRIRRATDVVVNDPYRDLQWGLDAARVPAAWDVTVGSTAVTVAVIDTGVSAVSELRGALVPGYDFVNRDAYATDDNGHGTSVASQIAAGANDGTGLAGICWTCRIMPVKVLDAQGSGRDSTVAAGIVWAADHGAKIINLSLGGPGGSTLLNNAVAHAIGKGALVIAAAGNAGTTTRSYPAAFTGVLAVAGSTPGGGLYSWSNRGSSWVDVAAPGCNVAQGRTGSISTRFCGTSSATPVVAGIAALALASRPGATGTALRAALTSTAVPLAPGLVYDGLVDAGAAIAAMAPTVGPRPSVRVTGPAAGTHVRGVVGFLAVASPDVTSIRAMVGGIQVAADGAAPWRLSWNTAGRNGASTVWLVVTDAGGDITNVAVPVTVDNRAPSVAFRTPSAGAKVRATVRVTATALDNAALSRVELLVNGRLVATDRAAPWSLLWPSGRTNARVTLGLRAYDRAGNMAVAARAVTVDNTAPYLRITKGPRNGANVRGTVRLAVAAYDRVGVRRVELLVNGKVVRRDYRSPYTFSVRTGAYGRRLSVRFRAYDQAGNIRYLPTRRWYS